MKFPNKINPYKSTVVFGMVKLHSMLKKPRHIAYLLAKAKKDGMDAKDVIDAIICLYAARKIEFDVAKGEIRGC